MTLGTIPDPQDDGRPPEPHVAYILAVIDNSVSSAAIVSHVGDPRVIRDIWAQRGSKGGINYRFGDGAWRSWNALSSSAVERLLRLAPQDWRPMNGWIGVISPLVAGMALEPEKTNPDDASGAG